MKKISSLLLILLLMLPQAVQGAGAVSLEGLTVPELEALRTEADGRMRLLSLPDKEGYLDVLDGEAYARDPAAHLNEKIQLSGEILRAEEDGGGYRYTLSLEGNPGRVFLLSYTMGEGERLLLPGDPVTAYGTFMGLSPFDGADTLESGALMAEAALITQRIPEKRLAAEPYAATRADPAPLGVTIMYEGSHETGYTTLEMELISSVRGAAALDRAKEMSKYNVTPLKTQEYLLAWVRVKALTAPGGKADMDNEDFSFVSPEGWEYPNHYLLNSLEAPRSLYEGGEYTALIACIIGKGDRPLIAYQPKSANPLWLNPNVRQVIDLAALPFKPLKQNDVGGNIPRMKTLLMEMGFLNKWDSGDKFTMGLRSALMAYQKASGMKATGVADEAAQRLLLSGVYPPGTPP